MSKLQEMPVILIGVNFLVFQKSFFQTLIWIGHENEASHENSSNQAHNDKLKKIVKMGSNSWERPILNNYNELGEKVPHTVEKTKFRSKFIDLDSECLDSTSRTSDKKKGYQKVYEKHTSKPRDDHAISIQSVYKSKGNTFRNYLLIV